MARLDPNYIWDKHSQQYPNTTKKEPFGISEFVTSSNTNNKLSHLNLYNSLWVSPLTPHDENSFRYRLRNLWWWQPQQDSIPVQFLESSSMHGLKYVSQPRRHILERLFWLVAFSACMAGAVFMILAIWKRYHQNPVIVTFNPAEQDLDSLPFPAVTICNINPIKKSTVEAYLKKYKQGKSAAERENALDALRVINGICLTQESFLQTLHLASMRGVLPPEARFNPSPEMEKNLTQFLHQNSQPCRELLRYCVWGQLNMECEKLFKPIITDYGKCCTFNMLPQELMETFGSVTQNALGNSASAKRFEWTPREIDEWRKWDYDTDGYILSQDLRFPYRQRRAGVTDGLSLLLDADVDNNFCPSTDSEGLKILYHLPLDAPRVADLGSVIGVNREIFLEVNPDLTIADPEIESYDKETRKCYFANEKKLQFYRPYTRSNCMEECWTNILFENCSCVLYYAPRNASTPICSTTPGTPEDTCVKDNERRYLGRLHRICSQCEYSCNDLTYHGQITSAQLQSGDILWTLANNESKPEWMNHKLTVFHVFMGSDSTVPKLRQKLYQAVDLIANTGGLLGLSIGFSVLSAVEIVYFATMRVFCQQLRNSERFGEPESCDRTITENHKTPNTKPASFIVTTGERSALKGFNNNGLSLLDNSNFLHEVTKRNFMAHKKDSSEGAALEQVIFTQPSRIIVPEEHAGFQPIPKDGKLIGEDKMDICWWSPPKDYLPVEFCQTTSIHGLGFVGRQKLHLSERIFWLVAFLLGVVAAVLLINQVWKAYNASPVIVTFQSQEMDTDSIPFPSVTICSMNAFPKSEVVRLEMEARLQDSDKANEAREALKYVKEICHSQQSFAKQFGFAKSRGEYPDLEMNGTITETSKHEMTNFLLKYTLPCEHLLRLCKFAEKEVDCKTFFKPVITDYGKCCTFNILPMPLLLNNLSKAESQSSTNVFQQQPWTKDDLELWKAWDYDEQGFEIANKSQLRPYRQRRAGLPYGLSILADSNIHDWYCPVSDSEGFRFLLHNPLDAPQVEDFASLVELNSEVMIEIHPEMTTADDDIRYFDMESRHCYFPEERQLLFYGPYTSGNCLSECTSLVLAATCNCTYFYMPRFPNVSICNSDPDVSDDFECVAAAKKKVKNACKNCEPLCENVDYHFETTTAKLQDPLKLWHDPAPGLDRPTWADNRMSVIHIFMGSETIVPKQRKRLYGVTDLIANTGGLLGLCLGFSVLSAMEVVYFLTLRTFWRVCGRKQNPQLHDRKASNVDYNSRFLQKVGGGGRVIQVNPNHVPLLDKTLSSPFRNPY